MFRKAGFVWLCGTVLLVALPGCQWWRLRDTSSMLLEYDSRKDFEEATRDTHLEPLEYLAGLALVQRDLLADETGEAYFGNVYYSDVGTEMISSDVWVRKQFLLDDAETRRAVLCLSGGLSSEGNPEFLVTVNDNAIRHRTDREEDPGIKYNNDWTRWLNGWLRIPVPVEHLEDGLNDVVIRGAGKTRWHVGIEPSLFPDRSAKSVDQGATWQRDRLGVRNSLNGEYVIRLALTRHPAKGTVTSPPLDLSAAAGDGTFGVPIALARLTVAADGWFPRRTGVDLRVRIGRTATYAPDTWTPWVPAKRFDAEDAESQLGDFPGFRYAQWQARLWTRDPMVTPQLCKITLEAAFRRGESLLPPGGVRIGHVKNPVIVRSSHPFTHLRPGPRVDLLRAQAKAYLEEHYGVADFDERMKSGSGQMQIARMLMSYVVRAMKGWSGKGRLHVLTPRDALVMMYLADKSRALGHVECEGFATALMQCCGAVGLNARRFGVGHIMTEVWSNQDQKWCVLDPSGSKYYEHPETHAPMSAMDLLRALQADGQADVVAYEGKTGQTKRKTGKVWWPFDRFLIDLRSNHIECGRPLHFMDTYSSRAHLVALNDKLTPLPFTDLQSKRAGDFEWTLNQARFHLLIDGDGKLAVQLESVTPNFRDFQVELNGEPADAQVTSVVAFGDEATGQLTLPLRRGENRLTCRPVNAFGVPGGTSELTLHCGRE